MKKRYAVRDLLVISFGLLVVALASCKKDNNSNKLSIISLPNSFNSEGDNINQEYMEYNSPPLLLLLLPVLPVEVLLL